MIGPVIPMITAIIEKDGKYLLMRRSEKHKTGKNQWQFPEGKLDFGENPVDALKREVKEETGLDLIDSEFLTYHSSVIEFPLGAVHLIRLVFRCQIEGKLRLSEEHRDWNYFTVEEMEDLDMVKSLKLTDIKKFLKK